MINLIHKLQDMLDCSKSVAFLAPLLLRLYLVPVFYMAGIQKYNNFEYTVNWFGKGLGLPLPELMAFMATAAELGGAFLLAIGLATRWICIPLTITMLVAIFTTHWHNGWLAVSAAGGLFATERTIEAVARLNVAKSVLTEHSNLTWITEHGSLVMLNNGIEFASTYLVMLVALFFLGGGKVISLDYWIAKKFRP